MYCTSSVSQTTTNPSCDAMQCRALPCYAMRYRFVPCYTYTMLQMGVRVMDSNDQERERGITILAKVSPLYTQQRELSQSFQSTKPAGM